MALGRDLLRQFDRRGTRESGLAVTPDRDAARLQQRIERYQGSVVTPARQRTSAALAAYRSNQLALTAVFEARHAEVEAQRKLLALQRDLVRTQAQLNLKPIAQGGAQ